MSRICSREEALFTDALALPATQRAEFLNTACGADPALRARLEALLAAHEASDTFLSRPASDGWIAPDEHPGDVIGGCKLLHRIGEGASGVVWMAEQEGPVQRRVALKVVKAGRSTPPSTPPPTAGESAFAPLNHPNLAQLFSRGATSDGRSYFVSEVVRGIPLTKYCDRQHLTPVQRLQLFLPPCEAILYAHRNGAIHGGLKPGNILVTIGNGCVTPKVTDLLVATATELPLVLRRSSSAWIYMSPEQIEAVTAADQRGDIYSLGIILYELLTGHPPGDASSMGNPSAEEIPRRIRELRVRPPSQQLRRLDDLQLATIARLRDMSPSALVELLRNDLDAIVMRCLEKDPARRYPMLDALVTDLRRYVGGEVARQSRHLFSLRALITRIGFGTRRGDTSDGTKR